MRRLLDALYAFLQEHRRCGALDSGVEAECLRMTCEWVALPSTAFLRMEELRA